MTTKSARLHHRHPRNVVAPKRREPEPRGRFAALTRSPRRLYLVALAAAALVAAALIGLSQLTAGDESEPAQALAPAGAALTGVSETNRMLDGIQQDGNLLGSPQAPVQLVVYTELQCPWCARFSQDVLPTLVQEYVGTGQVQIVLRGLAFLGPDSVTGLRTAVAAGLEDRLWNVTELLFANQGAENGWLTDDVLRAAVKAAGADPAGVFARRDSAAVTERVNAWAQAAQIDGVAGTPTFFVGKRGGKLEQVTLSSMTPAEFRAVLDGALGS
jgi:protein-disulfide isomerase